MNVKQSFRWIVRAALYYGAFELFAPYAITFGGGWPRISEGAVFAAVASSLHIKRLRPFGRLAARVLLFGGGVYLVFAAIWAAVTAEGYYGPVFWPAVGLLFVFAAAVLLCAFRLFKGQAMRLTAGAAAGKYTGGRRPRYGYTPDLEGQLQPEPGSNEPSPAFNGCALKARPCARSERQSVCTPNRPPPLPC